jgi:hypothetical protein
MVVLIVVLLLLWLGLGIFGFVVKGLLWIGLIALILFAATAIWGFLSGRSRA